MSNRDAIRKRITEGRSPHRVAELIIIDAQKHPGDWRLSARTQLAAVYKIPERDAMAIVSEFTGTLGYRAVVNQLVKDIGIFLDNEDI